MGKHRRGGGSASAAAGPRRPNSKPLSEAEQCAISGEKLKNEGNDFFVKDEYEEAVDRYKKAIEVNGPQPLYWSNLAAAYLKLKRYDLAEEAATSALTQDPWMLKALYRRGIARKETSQFLAAEKDFETILSKDPDFVGAQTELSAIRAILHGKPNAQQAPAASEPFFMQLCLAHVVFYDEIIEHTLSALRARVTLSRALDSATALELLSSPNLSGVFITDPGIAERKHSKVLAKLVEYVKSGGTVVAGGMFSTFIEPPDLTRFFRDSWGLPWKPGSCHRTTFSLNPAHETAKANPSLLPFYSMKAIHLKNIDLEAAIYVPTRNSRLQSLVWAPEPITNLSEAPVCQVQVGLGRLGYIGDLNGEEESTNTILAMLGVLEACPTPSEKSTLARFLIHLSLAGDFDANTDVLSSLRDCLTVSTVETAQQALPLLSSPILAGVFITDSRITEKKNEALLVELVAYAKAGGIVVMWGTFSASTSRPGMDAFFRKGWDLPWKMSSYHRTTFSLNRQNELATSNHKLQDSYSMKAVHLRDVPNEAALYLNASENLAETPVVFAEIGKGRLGYVGDVNSEVGSTKTVVAMFGLEPKPVLEATFGPTQ